MAQQTINDFVSDDAVALLGLLVDRGSCDLLDIGAGDCRIAAWFANQGHKVLAIDLHDVPLLGRNNRNLMYLKGNFYDVEIEKKFDCILIMGVLHYCKNNLEVKQLFKKAVSLLKPNGKLGAAWILQTRPNRRDVYEPSIEEVAVILTQESCDEQEGWTRQVCHNDHHGEHEHLMRYCVFEKSS